MRILFVTPYPPSRIHVRSYGFLTELQREHEVAVIAQCVSKQELTDAEALRNQGFEVIVVQESQRQAVLRSGRALFSNVPLQVAYARSSLFAQALQYLCSRHAFDVVHVEHLRGMASLEHLAYTLPLVWDAVDCISLLCKYTMAGGPSLAVRSIARLEHERTRHYEAKLLRQLRHVVVTSERDRQAMIELHRGWMCDQMSSEKESGVEVCVLPNGVDLEYFCPVELERRRFNIVFSGKMSYHANVATALYLHRQIMPLIWQELPEATLTIAGSGPPKAIQLLARDPRVEVTGYVYDMRPYIQRAEVMLSPMVYSVGIQNKVLEAMALGTPVVVAAQAAEALGAHPGRDLLVAQSPQEFADATLQLIHDAALHATLRQFGRSYVEEQHNWRVATERLVDIYSRAVAIHRYKEITRSAEESLVPSISL
jgi:polysaccharide biosynthesis protein PslH